MKIQYDMKKTFVLPLISALVMGIAAFGTYKLLSLLLGLFMGSEYFVNLIACAIAIMVAVFVYFVVLIRSGGASEGDIKRFPKGGSIVSILKKIRVL